VRSDVGGAQQPLAVQVRLAFRCGSVDAQQPGRGSTQVAAQPGLVLQAPDELRAPAGGPRIGSGDQPLLVAGQVRPDGGVTLALFGVVADHEPHRPGTLVTVAVPAGGDGDLLDPQVPGHGGVAARAGQRGGRLDVGVAQLLGVDVVPTAGSGRRQVGAEVLGVPERSPTGLDRVRALVVSGAFGQLGALGLPVGRGRVHED